MLDFTNILKILPIIRFDLFNSKESCFLVKTSLLHDCLLLLKNHFSFQFKILTCIAGVDYPNNKYRFQIVYELLSVKYNSRLRIKIVVNEIIPIQTVESIYLAATWWESEIWDMFGVFFYDQKNLTKLLTDYGFQGYPLRKDFPLMGFLEVRYNYYKNRVVYEKVELLQEFRSFTYLSPWEKL